MNIKVFNFSLQLLFEEFFILINIPYITFKMCTNTPCKFACKMSITVLTKIGNMPINFGKTAQY